MRRSLSFADALPLPFPALRVVVCVLCCSGLSFATPWTVAHQAPLSRGFPRQECWSGLPFPSPGHLPDPGIELASPALADRIFTAELPGFISMIGEVIGHQTDRTSSQPPSPRGWGMGPPNYMVGIPHPWELQLP